MKNKSDRVSIFDFNSLTYSLLLLLMGYSCWIFGCKNADFSRVIRAVQKHNELASGSELASGEGPEFAGEVVTVDEILCRTGQWYFLLCHNLGGRDFTSDFFMKERLDDYYNVYLPLEGKPLWYGHPEMTTSVWKNETGDSKVFPE